MFTQVLFTKDNAGVVLLPGLESMFIVGKNKNKRNPGGVTHLLMNVAKW